jgi:hypothetical protein
VDNDYSETGRVSFPTTLIYASISELMYESISTGPAQFLHDEFEKSEVMKKTQGCFEAKMRTW